EGRGIAVQAACSLLPAKRVIKLTNGLFFRSHLGLQELQMIPRVVSLERSVVRIAATTIRTSSRRSRGRSEVRTGVAPLCTTCLVFRGSEGRGAQIPPMSDWWDSPRHEEPAPWPCAVATDLRGPFRAATLRQV